MLALSRRGLGKHSLEERSHLGEVPKVEPLQPQPEGRGNSMHGPPLLPRSRVLELIPDARAVVEDQARGEPFPRRACLEGAAQAVHVLGLSPHEQSVQRVHVVASADDLLIRVDVAVDNGAHCVPRSFDHVNRAPQPRLIEGDEKHRALAIGEDGGARECARQMRRIGARVGGEERPGDRVRADPSRRDRRDGAEEGCAGATRHDLHDLFGARSGISREGDQVTRMAGACQRAPKPIQLPWREVDDVACVDEETVVRFVSFSAELAFESEAALC